MSNWLDVNALGFVMRLDNSACFQVRQSGPCIVNNAVIFLVKAVIFLIKAFTSEEEILSRAYFITKSFKIKDLQAKQVTRRCAELQNSMTCSFTCSMQSTT